MQTNRTLPAAVRQAVEDALSARFGGRVHIAVEVHNFWPSWVFRCTLVQSSCGGAPQTVIVRVPREGTVRAGRTGLHNEHAALQYLNAIGSALAPRFLAGGGLAGFLVTEDLGAHPSLLDLLLGKDPQAATQAILAFARGLGRLHAQTAGQPECLQTIWNRTIKLVYGIYVTARLTLVEFHGTNRLTEARRAAGWELSKEPGALATLNPWEVG